MIVAIDGPSGAGKSTTAQAVARKLGFTWLDTGAMYRAIAWAALKRGVDLNDDAVLGDLARSITVRFERDGDTQRVFADDEDVTSAIRSSQVDKAVSPVSAAPSVREALTAQQRSLGSAGDFVVEGRDIGSTVFPGAEVKIFLVASPEERARRRASQNAERGVGSTDYQEILAALKRRDELDSSRGASPLRKADDALLLDSTALTFDEVVDSIVEAARRVRGRS